MKDVAAARAQPKGFTLIEMSIVLVIIGLIVGGVLVGQDLIRASAVRGQITQIQKYNTAVTIFFAKYNALPGDMLSGAATGNGFAARGPEEVREIEMASWKARGIQMFTTARGRETAKYASFGVTRRTPG